MAWLRTLRQRSRLVLSPQVLNESFWVVQRKPAFAHARPHIRSYLSDYVPWTTAPLSADTLLEAFNIMDGHRVGFWDSLLLASAKAARCAYFLSEDLNDGQVYGAVKAINPFRHAPEDVLGPALQS